MKLTRNRKQYRNCRTYETVVKCDGCGLESCSKWVEYPYKGRHQIYGKSIEPDIKTFSAYWGYNSIYDSCSTSVDLCSSCWANRFEEIHTMEDDFSPAHFEAEVWEEVDEEFEK